MARSKMTITAGNPVGQFVRILPENIRQELDIYADSLPPLDLVGALNALEGAELQTALRSSYGQARFGPELARLGVDNNKGRPRVPGLVVVKLVRGLSRGEMSAKVVLSLLTDGVYKLLLVQAAGLTAEIPPGWYREELDTPTLRALAVMGAHRLNDPSAPWALAAMVRSEDPAIKVLVKPDDMEHLRQSTGQFLRHAEPEQNDALREWVRRRAALTEQSVPAAAIGQVPAQRKSADQQLNPSASSSTGAVTVGNTDSAASISPSPALAADSSVTPGVQPSCPADGSLALNVDSALGMLGQQFADAASVLLPRLTRALTESYAPDEDDLAMLVALRALLVRTSREIAVQTSTTQTTSLP